MAKESEPTMTRRCFFFCTVVLALSPRVARVRAADEGVLRLAGTETLIAWMQQVGLGYSGQQPGMTLHTEKIGADHLVSALLAGGIDGALLPRPVSENELTLARVAKKLDLRTYPVALGAVLVIVNRSNPIESISVDQVGKLLSQAVVTWQQLEVKTTGTPLAMPKARRTEDGQDQAEETPSPIMVLVPSSGLGTDEWLRRRTLGLAAISPHVRRANSSAEMVQLVSENVRAIGFVALPVPEGVKAIPVRAHKNGPAVPPQPGTIGARNYPLTHYVYVVTSDAPTTPLRDWMAFLLSEEGQRTMTAEKGLLPLSVLENSGAAHPATK